MIILITVSILLTFTPIISANPTDNLIRRGLTGQTFFYNPPDTTLSYPQFPFYHDLTNSAASIPTNYNSNNPKPLLIHSPLVQAKTENEPSTPLTFKQIFYEVQQTPVEQHSKTATEQKPYITQPYTHHNGIIRPVQHGAVIHHGQGYTKFFYPFNIQPQIISQQKNFYPTGKPVYPTQNYNNFQDIQVVTQKPLKPSPTLPYIYNNYQQVPLIKSMPPLNKNVPPPVKENIKEDSDEKEEAREREEEEYEEQKYDDYHSNYEAEDDDDNYKPDDLSKYQYGADDDDEEEHYRHERYQDEDEGEDRSSSYTKYVNKNSKTPSKNNVPNQKKLKAYTKTSSYHKKDPIEGRYSDNVPIIHNKKFERREKWLITEKTSE